MFNLFKSKCFYLNGLKLDKYQSRAVFCNSKCYLVVSGAGSGKSLTIVGKVKYLIDVMKVREDQILCISFTNETVCSLKDSILKNNINIDVKTFHRLAMDIISSKKFSIASSSLLNYVCDEYFYSYIYFDNSYKLLSLYLEDNDISYEEFINNFKNTVVSFIRIFKACGYSLDYFTGLLFDNSIPINDKLLLVLIFKVYVLYEEELLSTNSIDFDDMLNLACMKVNKLKYFRYKYIIIDEYQDTSYVKFNLIKNLVDKFDINLMAVGDDFQSIYSFTGCDVSLFLNFKNKFSGSSIIKLKYNYRNSKDIVDISRRFILKNKYQMRKNISSLKFIKDSIVVVYSKDVVLGVCNIIKELDNILILGRNNKDIDLLVDNESFSYDKELIYLKDRSKNMRFLTVHSSKGLEADYVILLNVIDESLGFPNKVVDSPINKYLKLSKEKYPYAEERRLFYVALTRARKKIYIFTLKNRESSFVLELLKDYRHKVKVIDFL